MFCKFLSNSYHFTYDYVKPCCWFKTKDTSILLDPNEIKKKFVQLHQVNEWIPECDYCRKLEDAGTQSPRTIATTEEIFSDDDLLGETIKVELQLDQDCNAACLVCGVWNSTTWQQYTDKTINNGIEYFKNKTTVDDRVAAVTNIVNFDKVKQIHFFGGEPFNTDTHLRVLKQIKYPENIKLVYVTNGSIFPSDETLEIWQKFKNINVAFSIDGTEDHFNYLRWPLQWHQVIKNLEKFITLCSNKFQMNTSFTSTPLNLFYVDRYTEWASEFFKDAERVKSKSWFLNPHPTDISGPINLHCIPLELQNIIKAKYGKDSRIGKILVPFDPVKYKTFINYLNFHDKHRKLSWRETFSEIQHYFPEL